jgi:hypothetical protein
MLGKMAAPAAMAIVLALGAQAQPVPAPAQPAAPRVQPAPRPAPAAAPRAVPAAAAKVNPAVERVAQAIGRAGVKRCHQIMAHVAKFLIENGDAGYTIKILGDNPDAAPAMLTLETTHASLGTTRYATVITVPNDKCAGYYEQSIYWAAPCPQVKAANFGNFPAVRPLLRGIGVSEPSAQLQLSFVPAGQGCMTVKKEIFR